MEQNHCGYFGFPIDRIVAGFDPEVILLLRSKFRLKVTKRLERDIENWFARWWLWRLSWIFNLLNFSYLVSTRRSNAHHQDSSQLDYTGDVQNMNSQHFPILMYRAHTNAWGSKYDLVVKGQRSMYDHNFSNFGRPPVHDDLCKDKAEGLFWFWRRRF